MAGEMPGCYVGPTRRTRRTRPTRPSPECCRFSWVRRTALHKCTEHRIATKLLAAGAKFNRLDKKHVSPLCFACLHNKFAVARVLLEWRADVNGAAPFAHSHTPLMVACSRGYDDIVALVRRAGLRRPIPFAQLPRRLATHPMLTHSAHTRGSCSSMARTGSAS